MEVVDLEESLERDSRGNIAIINTENGWDR